MQIEIIAAKREGQGTSASRRLRHAGQVPGIVYGGEVATQPIAMDHNALWHTLKHEAAHSSVLSLNVAGVKESVLLRDVQYHPYKQQIMHADFLRVVADHAIHMNVPLHFKNEEIAPGVKLHGGIMSHVFNEVEVVCLPANLPEFIEVDVSGLDLGDSLHLSHLKLPAGVELTALLRHEDPTVVSVVAPKGAGAGEEAASEAGEAGVEGV